MNILLVGGPSRFLEAMVNKLNKEGCRVFVLTGDVMKNAKYPNVFEVYRFSFMTDEVSEIFESVNPDIIIYTGAFDTNMDWESAKESSVRFSSGLLNLLIAFTLLKKECRFLFLSSHEIYQRSYQEDVLEDEPPTATGIKNMALALGEQMCLNYQEASGKDIIILRMDHMMGIPHNRAIIKGYFSKLCLQAFQDKKITIDPDKSFSMLYINDAMEFTYKVLSSPEHKYQVYNLSSGLIFTEMELAQMIKDAMGGDLEIIEAEGTRLKRLALSGQRFHDEFGGKVFFKASDIVNHTIEYMNKHPNDFLREEQQKVGYFKRLFNRMGVFANIMMGYIEATILFIPFFLLNNRAADSTYFQNVDIFLIYVLIFAIIRGQQEATYAGVLATIGFIFRSTYDRTALQVLADYNTYVWIAQLFILGMSVGYLKDRLEIVQTDDAEELEYVKSQLRDIKEINESNVTSKNVLETEVINHNQSIGTVYEITSSLERFEPEEVIFYAAEVVGQLILSKEVAIYSVANRSYARLFSATSPKARRLGNSVNYSAMEEMYSCLKEKRVYINKTMDEAYPLMANAIYSEDEMQLIIMVWGIPWERMNLGQANMLTVVGYLIQNAVIRANRFIEVLRHERYVEGTNVLETRAFRSLVNAYINAFHKGLAEYTLLSVNCNDEDQYAVAAKLQAHMRQTDSFGILEDENLYVLLTNTPQKDASFVMNRFSESGYESKIVEESVQ